MMTGTTRLHIDLLHIPQLCRSSKLNCCKTNNNSNRPVPYPSNSLFVKCKQKSVCLMQSRSDSFYKNIPTPVRSSTASSPSVHPTINPTHPYLRDGWSTRRKPKKFLSSSIKQSPSHNLINYPDAYLPKVEKAPFQGDDEETGLTVKQRKELLMTSTPHFRRSITPNEFSGPQATNSDVSYEVPIKPDSNEGKENFLRPIALNSPFQNTVEPQSAEETNSKKQTQSSPVEELPSLSMRPKLSLSRRCSEATLPLTFSFKMPTKSQKAVKKPRSKTYDVIPETENISFGNELNSENATDSDLIKMSEVLLNPSQDPFMNSRILRPRHSVYFYHSPMNFDNTPEQIDSLPQFRFNEASAAKSIFGIQLESSQQDCSDNSPESTPVLPYQDTYSFLSDSSLTEESSPGGCLISSGPIENSNKDINHSENYSNTLDSQECINVTSSSEDIVGENLSDSGYHFDQQANRHFSTQSVKKVILDLSQQKYIGLSLVGGADSPFGNLPVLVKEIMSGGAAECCDISRGDEILGINNVSLEEKPLQFAVERLRHCSSRDEEIILWVIPQVN